MDRAGVEAVHVGPAPCLMKLLMDAAAAGVKVHTLPALTAP